MTTALRSRILLGVLLAAAVIPYFVDLGGSSIWDANEAFYVETPREMMERGDYVAPTFNYEPRFNKPVLSYWIVAGFYRAFGISVGVQRLPIALGAVVMILCAFLLARAASPPSVGRARAMEAALLAALGLAIAPRLLMFARRIFIDIYISVFMALTLLFFALSERHPARRRLFLFLMYVAVGLGALTKGPVAIALPGLAFAVYLVAHGELKRTREMMLPLGILVVLAIVVPWYAALYLRFGWTYITSFFLGENIARYTEGFGVQQSRGPWFYIPVVLTDSLPWSLCLFGAAAMWWTDRRAGITDTAERLALRIRTLLWIWILTIVMFFTLSAAKQDLYIFPIVPAVAALAGVFIMRALSGANGQWRLPLRATLAAAGLLLIAAGAAVLYLFEAAGKTYPLAGAVAVGLIGAIGGVAVAVLAFAGRSPRALVALAVTFVLLNWTFVLRVLPSFEQYKPVLPLSQAIARSTQPGDVVAHYDVAMPSMVYYLRQHIDMHFEREPFLALMRGGNRVFAVLSERDYQQLLPDFGVATCVIERRPEANVKLNEVLAGDPLPQIVLITNRCQ